LLTFLASIFGGIILRDRPKPVTASRENTKITAAYSPGEIDKKKAGFIHHFLVNDFDP